MIDHATEFMLIGIVIAAFGIAMLPFTKGLTVGWVAVGVVALGGVIFITFLYAFLFTSISSEESKEVTIGNVSMSCEEIMEDTEVEGVDKETVALYQKLKDSNVSQDEIEKVFSAVFSADELKTLERDAAKFQDSTKLDKMIRDHCEGDEVHRQGIEQKR